MATTKKTHTTKKVTPTKKKMVKKASAKVRARPLTWRFYVVTIGIFFVAVATVVVVAYLTAHIVDRQNSQARLDRIEGIYASLNLDDTYIPQSTAIFGDKRVYDWDKSRTQSSKIEYLHGDTVSNTVAALDAKIKAAGFTFFDEPYPTQGSTQYHYKSSKGEYIRLTVTSKPYWDANLNASVMKDDSGKGLEGLDTNAGPSVVTVKVNLDDNNE